MRFWIFAAAVAVVLAANLALVSRRMARSGEDSIRSRVALASSALQAQLQLVDARLDARAVASVPELIEAVKPPVDPTVPLARPDEKALRAAASAVQPAPDLLAVASAQGAIVSRRGKAAQQVDDPSSLPLVKQATEGGNATPVFVKYGGSTWRAVAARIPGTSAVVLVGALVDDGFAAQLRSQIDADVTLLQNGAALASSAPPEERARVVRWAAAPAPGYGALHVVLPGIGDVLTGRLPRLASRFGVRAALVPLDSGVQAAITLPAGPWFGWLARYQAWYLAGLALYVLFAFLWGLLLFRRPRMVAAAQPAEAPRVPVAALDVGEGRQAPPARPARDVPWSAGEGPSGEHPVVRPEDQPAPFPPLRHGEQEPEVTSSPVAAAHDPMWSADPFSPTPGQFTSATQPEEGLRELPAPASAEPSGAEDQGWGAAPAEPAGYAEQAGYDEQAGYAERAGAPAWDAPTPGEQPQPASDAARGEGATGEAEERGWDEAAPAVAAPEPAPSSAAKGDFSFAGLLDEVHAGTAGPGQAAASDAPAEQPQEGAGGEPAAPPASAEPQQEYFPGDEPTRIEPVSAALLDKLREKDEEEQAPDWSAQPPARPAEAAAQPEPTREEPLPVPPAGLEPEPPQAAAASAEPEGDQEADDPDLPHWHETFDQFIQLKQSLGESADRISFEKFSAKLRKNRDDLIARHNCRGVRFVVYEKQGKAAIKASALR